jgi:NAD(P)-dependent dehydrogenase (short-subunit alcohol dehydrogenase family)
VNKTIVVCGHGGGISDAVARRFGAEGFRVALVARNEARVVQAARELGNAGIEARGFGCDLGDSAAVETLIAQVRDALGPITVLHWNAFAPLAGDFTTSRPEDLRTVFDVAVTGMVVAVQESLEDMRQQEGAAVLVTGGGFGLTDPNIDATIVKLESMGLGLAKAAQHKLVGMLNKRLAPDGIYVGEVMVLGLVKGTASDQGQATLEPSAIADRFWEIYRQRSSAHAQIG